MRTRLLNSITKTAKRYKTIATVSCITVAVIILVVTIPLATNYAFSTRAILPLFEAKFDASSFLQYLITCLSVIATCLLSCVSFLQAKELRRRQEKQELYNTKRPFLVLSSLKNRDASVESTTDQNGDRIFNSDNMGSLKLDLQVFNVGDGPACNVGFYPYAAFGEPLKEHLPGLCIPADNAAHLDIVIPKESGKGGDAFEIRYSNILGQLYSQTLQVYYHLEQGEYGPRRNIIVKTLSSQTEISSEKIDE